MRVPNRLFFYFTKGNEETHRILVITLITRRCLFDCVMETYGFESFPMNKELHCPLAVCYSHRTKNSVDSGNA